MTTPPPPPPGNGSNQPFDPSGPVQPPPGQGPGMPSYGSAPGQPPQTPPPAPGGAPQGGTDTPKILSIISMVTGIAGIIICCCWGVPIFSAAALITGFVAKSQTTDNPRPDLKTFILVGLITGAIGLVLAIVYWILYAAGAISFDTYNDF